MALRSNEIITGLERAPQRAYLNALGLPRTEFSKPFIGVVNTWNEVSLSNCHLNLIVQSVKAGILAGGGVPFEFNTIAVSDGYAEAHDGMNYVLASRELIADSIEIMALAHRFDGIVILAAGDKPIPAALMAMPRLNIPAILINGGSSPPAKYRGKDVSFFDVLESVGDYHSGRIREDAVFDKEEAALPGAGDGAGMYTPSTMACLAEAMGLCLPYSSTVAALCSQKLRHARLTGQIICRLVEEGLTPKKIITENSIRNAIRVGQALGGSTNMALHLLAVAREAGLEISLGEFDKLGRQTPMLCPIDPNGPFHINDLDTAGGVPGVMSRLRPLLDLSQLTITGKTVGENIQDAGVYNDEVIRPLERPLQPEGSLIVLRGNLATKGAVVRQSFVNLYLRRFRGPARVFDREEEAVAAVHEGRISRGDVIVLRYLGPKGGPGMPEVFSLISTIRRVGLSDSVYLLTDGRFHGVVKGACVGHICPEAAEGGLIAPARDGDMIAIDLDLRQLELEVPDEELLLRRSALKPFIPRERRDYLGRYVKLVSPASEGAVLR